MARPCTPRPETTRSKPRCSRPHRIWNTSSHACSGSSPRRLPMPYADNNRKKQKMNKSKCPHCHVELGNFLYADACPHCHKELKDNTRPLSATKVVQGKAKIWAVQMLGRLQRFAES